MFGNLFSLQSVHTEVQVKLLRVLRRALAETDAVEDHTFPHLFNVATDYLWRAQHAVFGSVLGDLGVDPASLGSLDQRERLSHLWPAAVEIVRALAAARGGPPTLTSLLELFTDGAAAIRFASAIQGCDSLPGGPHPEGQWGAMAMWRHLNPVLHEPELLLSVRARFRVLGFSVDGSTESLAVALSRRPDHTDDPSVLTGALCVAATPTTPLSTSNQPLQLQHS